MLAYTEFAYTAIGLYLIATGLIWRRIRNEPPLMGRKADTNPKHILLAWSAALFHGLSLVEIFSGEEGINFGFFSTAALVILIVVVLVLASARSKPLDKLGLLVFPLAAILLFLKTRFPGAVHLLQNPSFGMEVHILVSILAFSLLNIAAVQAILLALQEWQLRHHHPNRLIRSLPPLQTMESLLFEMIAVGFSFLTISLISGFFFVHDLFAQHLVHKTLLSIVAWLVFGILLWGRAYYGWRGQTAIRWALWGFFFLMLAYFGSKLVLELILKRSWS